MQNKIKVKVINILDLKEKCNLECNLDITLELYKIFSELSIKCFSKGKKDKQSLCYDQLCIYLDSINDNMCDGLVSIEYDTYDSGLIECD